MHRSLMFLLLLPIASAEAQNFQIDLGSAMADAVLKDGEQHAANGRQFESAGQWLQARAEYLQAISFASQALHNSPTAEQAPVIYYVLGLAETDAVRMFRVLQVDRDKEMSYLAGADEALQRAASLAQNAGIPAWYISCALTNVHIMQGNLAAAQADLERIRTLNSGYQPAVAALEQFKNPLPALTRAAAAVRDRLATASPADLQALEALLIRVASALVPARYKAAIGVVVNVSQVGLALYQQSLAQPRQGR